MARFVPVCLLCVAATAACASETTEPSPSRVQQTVQSPAPHRTIERTIAYLDRGSRWRFDMPAPPLSRVESRRFAPTTPAHKVKERIEVKNDTGLLVRIDVWDNPGKTPAPEWIDSHMSYLRLGETTFHERTVGKARARAVVADQPRSHQSANLRTAVFALDEHMVAVMCANAEDPTALETFDIVLSSFAKEDAR